jgi:hypothetical protein
MPSRGRCCTKDIFSYPYRRTAIKNRQRWTTGGLLPSAYCAEHKDEASALRVECLFEGDAATALDVEVRFLQLMDGPAPVRSTPWNAASSCRSRRFAMCSCIR